MAKVIFITGGVASGKSAFACKMAEKSKSVLFIATAQKTDSEMKTKIIQHRRLRPAKWKVIELENQSLESLNIPKCETIILDCVTMYVATRIHLLNFPEKNVAASLKKFIKDIKESRELGQLIIVSNEVGMGIVPESLSGRQFRESLGRINKMIATLSDNVYLMISGLNCKLK